MQNHIVKSDLVFHGIPDMSSTPLSKLVLLIAANRLTEDESTRTLLKNASETETPLPAAAIEEISLLLSAPRNEPGYIEGLQYLGAAFSQAYKLNTPAPENLTQSQWNRALRDQGERLRSASLTLGSGRETIAIEQLSSVVEFVQNHFQDLPR
jgi:hypothetical protein